MAGSLRMFPIWQTPNSDILTNTTTDGPPLPTIADLNTKITSRRKFLWHGRRGLLYLPNGEFLTQVKLYHHLQPALADPAPDASDVYLVTRPPFIENPQGSFNHWSFYTQGVFYHLSAPGLPRDSSRKIQGISQARDVSCKLKCEDLSSTESAHYIRFTNTAKPKLLLAYKVGQTDYRTEQVRELADWLVHQLSIYGIFSANRQHFATTIVRRTAMRVGDRSTFAGTAVQLSDWDLKRGKQPHVNDVRRGFVIAPPRNGKSPFLYWFAPAD